VSSASHHLDQFRLPNSEGPIVPARSALRNGAERPDGHGWWPPGAIPLESSPLTEADMSKKTLKRKLRSRRKKANHGKRPNSGRR